MICAGCRGEFMLMSIMAWENLNQTRVYIERADRAKMAQVCAKVGEDKAKIAAKTVRPLTV